MHGFRPDCCKDSYFFYFCSPKIQQGSLAEWLGSGLQNRVRRFESARNLDKKPSVFLKVFFINASNNFRSSYTPQHPQKNKAPTIFNSPPPKSYNKSICCFFASIATIPRLTINNNTKPKNLPELFPVKNLIFTKNTNYGDFNG